MFATPSEGKEPWSITTVLLALTTRYTSAPMTPAGTVLPQNMLLRIVTAPVLAETTPPEPLAFVLSAKVQFSMASVLDALSMATKMPRPYCALPVPPVLASRQLRKTVPLQFPLKATMPPTPQLLGP